MAILVDQFVQDIIITRKIKYLYHFTDFENVCSIMDKGLISVEKLVESDIPYSNTDIRRYDNNLKFISCSVEFPNYLYLNSLIKRNGNKYVVFRLHIECIFNTEIILHKSNPYLPRWGTANKFEDLFFEEYRFPFLPAKYPTDPRAEIQVKDGIGSHFIDIIFFPTNFNNKSAIFDLARGYPNYCFAESDYYFMPRIDFPFWKNIRFLGIDIYKL